MSRVKIKDLKIGDLIYWGTTLFDQVPSPHLVLETYTDNSIPKEWGYNHRLVLFDINKKRIDRTVSVPKELVWMISTIE